MTALSEQLLRKYYANNPHPYRLYEQHVDTLLKRSDTLLDAGCGRTFPVLKKYLGRAERLIGVELVDFTDTLPGIETYNADLAKIPLPDASVDLIMSRSVFEHLTDPDSVYREFSRILRPRGSIVFLTANMWDYGTLVARLVPNRFHAKIVKHVEGRAEEDTFPIAYNTNTRSDVDRLAASAGLAVDSFQYLSQYPNYLMFNGALFFLGMCFEKLISHFESLRILRGWIMVTLRNLASQIETVHSGDNVDSLVAMIARSGMVLFGALTPPRLSILIFHRVHARADSIFPSEPDAVRFERLMRFVARSFRVMALGEAVTCLANGNLPSRALVITFDDGYADNAEVALPILQRCGLTASFFVSTGFLDGGRMWNDSVIECLRACRHSEIDLDSFGLGRCSLVDASNRRHVIESLLPTIKYLGLREGRGHCQA